MVKNTILEVSLKLFKQFGYSKTTIEEIAEQAGIGKGSVYLHFKSKEEILLTLIYEHNQAIIAEWDRIVHQGLLPEKKIHAMLKNCIADIQQKKKEMFLNRLPPRLLQEVLKISYEIRPQKLALLATALEPFFKDEPNSYQRDRLARILWDSTFNLMFRLDTDINFQWEQFLDDALKLMLPKSEQAENPRAEP